MSEQRRELNYKSADDVIEDVERLRRGGYKKLGGWTLPQACYHLNTIMKFLMRPGPHEETTPEQAARHARLEIILASGQLGGKRIEAPEAVTPPPGCGDECIDQFIKTLPAFQTHKGYAPHRIFGKLTDDEMRKLNLIHCAHHFGFLLPK